MLRTRYANSIQHSAFSLSATRTLREQLSAIIYQLLFISYQLIADRCFTGWKPVPQS
ncbi:hypothetical protein [Moorena bouillonii]|uniref:hypothetical protein n=1 Tax=Moorena bouillonii TaxID=207920 RepID=UPI001301701D|nr:hypothetical protein [Moorena bouillonii]